MAARDRRVAEAIAAAVAELDGTLILVGLAGSELIAAGTRLGLQTVSEAFADRAYRRDGSLVPRALPGAVLEDAEVVTARAVAMVRDQRVMAIDGSVIQVVVETLCIHGDTPGAATLARRIREALEISGVQVRAFR